ncbi:MAG: LacI family transcriptional regulator [Lachnospiraceae bacterium]|nr:LacI family transcriptional regulator [Lachnospiraceae bacterium]
MKKTNGPKKPTRNDVAKLAGVSSAVVSYVLNDMDCVSDDKRKAVWAAVEQLGYYPNVSARALRTNKTFQIALVCENILYNEWLYNIENILFEKQYYVSMCHSQPTGSFLQMIAQRQYDAIYLMSNYFNEQQLNGLADSGVPIILFKTKAYDQPLGPGIATVAPLYEDGVKKIINYLSLKGHKRIGYIPTLRYGIHGLSGNDFRMRGYVEAMELNGLPLDERLVCMNTASLETICDSIFNMLSLSPSERPTALAVMNDYLAAQVMKYLKQLGIRVPEDIAITGMDNANVASITSPALTTVDFSKSEFAKHVSHGLISLIRGENVGDIYLPMRLVIGESA